MNYANLSLIQHNALIAGRSITSHSKYSFIVVISIQPDFPAFWIPFLIIGWILKP